MNKIIGAIPLVAIAVLGYFSLTKAQPVSLLPENKFSSDNPDIPENLTEYEVVSNSVYDGDTLRVRSLRDGTSSPQGEVLKVRFACIDAPELKQPLGQESRNYLRFLIYQGGNKVKLQPITTDRYGRTVAQLWNNGGLIQSQMVIKGMAYGYAQYKKDCPNWSAIESTEVQAQQMKIGVWKTPQEKPWDYRKSKR